MGWYVHLHVCFACDFNDGVAELARKHLETIEDDGGNDHYEARLFLQDLSKRTGTNEGPKGGLSLWGIIGNFTKADVFVEALRPFWEELLSRNSGDEDSWEDESSIGFPLSFEHVLVFYEDEGFEAASAYEIGWDDPDAENRKLIIRHHGPLPFAWMQG